MTDIVDSRRRSQLMAGIRGCDAASIFAVWRIALGLGLYFRWYRKGTLDASVLLIWLEYHQLPHSDKSESGLNGDLLSRGASFVCAFVPRPCHAGGGSSVGTSDGLSCEGSGSILISEGWRYIAGLEEPAAKLGWYFHDQ